MGANSDQARNDRRKVNNGARKALKGSKSATSSLSAPRRQKDKKPEKRKMGHQGKRSLATLPEPEGRLEVKVFELPTEETRALNLSARQMGRHS